MAPCICESWNSTYPVDVVCPIHGLVAVGPDPRDIASTEPAINLAAPVKPRTQQGGSEGDE